MAQVHAEWGTGWSSAFVAVRPVKAGRMVKMGSDGSRRLSLMVKYRIVFLNMF